MCHKHERCEDCGQWICKCGHFMDRKEKGENTMSDNNELIEKMKNNWTAWGGLSDKEREFLKENSDSVGMIVSSGSLCYVGDCKLNEADLVYRLSPDFSLPEPVSDWVEYDIYEKDGQYRCQVYHYNMNRVASCVHENPLDDLPSIVGFAGVQFEGQRDSEMWFPSIVAFHSENQIHDSRILCPFAPPATPIKARFFVGKEGE